MSISTCIVGNRKLFDISLLYNICVFFSGRYEWHQRRVISLSNTPTPEREHSEYTYVFSCQVINLGHYLMLIYN